MRTESPCDYPLRGLLRIRGPPPRPRPFLLLNAKPLRPKQPRSRIMILSLKKKKKSDCSLPQRILILCLFLSPPVSGSSRLSRVQRRQPPTPVRVPLGSCSLQVVVTTSSGAAHTRGDSARDPDLEPGERGGHEPLLGRTAVKAGRPGTRDLGEVSWGWCQVDILLLKEPRFFCLQPRRLSLTRPSAAAAGRE